MCESGVRLKRGRAQAAEPGAEPMQPGAATDLAVEMAQDAASEAIGGRWMAEMILDVSSQGLPLGPALRAAITRCAVALAQEGWTGREVAGVARDAAWRGWCASARHNREQP